jgi:hypothetical protein
VQRTIRNEITQVRYSYAYRKNNRITIKKIKIIRKKKTWGGEEQKEKKHITFRIIWYGHPWLTPIILTTWEADIRRIAV